MAKIELKPIVKKIMTISIKSEDPVIHHKWTEKARRMMEEKHAGKKTKNREKRNPQEEADNGTYKTDDGRYGFPAMALKNAIISAAHKDNGIEKTLVRKALFIICKDSQKIIPFTKHSEPWMRQDMVNVGQNSADMRYRNQFDTWNADVKIEIDADLLGEKDVLTLVDWAGSRVGICEWRPEKGGDYGRFSVDLERKIHCEEKQ